VPTSHSLTILTSVVFILLSYLASAEPQSNAQLPPADLVRAVICREMNTSDATDIHWRYLLDKDVEGRRETREVVETKAGSIDRLVAINGKPLDDTQQHDEAERILRLSHDSEEQRKLEQTRRKDAQQANASLRMIPDAFLFEYAGQSADLFKLTFRPNPRFKPPSREGTVLHQMAGEMWIDGKQQRLLSINGQLMNDVKFGGGLLGHLEKSGQFAVKRAEIASNHWELTELTVNMRGKALLFKTISVQQKEFRTNFRLLPANLTLSDAAGLLLKRVLVAARQ
jgi:hypothetical protein